MSSFDFIPREILGVILSFVPFSGSNWLHTKLVNKKWKEVGDRVFDPSKCNALHRLLNNEAEESVILLLQDPRVDLGESPFNILYHVVQWNMIKLADLLLKDPRIDPSQHENVLVRNASKYGQLEMVNRVVGK